MRKGAAAIAVAAALAGGAAIYLSYRRFSSSSSTAPKTPPRKEAEEHEKYQQIYDSPEQEVLSSAPTSSSAYPSVSDNLEEIATAESNSSQNLYNHLIEQAAKTVEEDLPTFTTEELPDKRRSVGESGSAETSLYPQVSEIENLEEEEEENSDEQIVLQTNSGAFAVPSAPPAATWSDYHYLKEEDDATTMIEIYLDCLPKLPKVVGYLNVLYSFVHNGTTAAADTEEENQNGTTTTSTAIESYHRTLYRDIVIITEAGNQEQSSEALVKPIVVPKGAFKIIQYNAFPSTRTPTGVLQVTIPEVLATGNSSIEMTREVVHYLVDFIQLYFKSPFAQIPKPLPGKLAECSPSEYHRFFEELSNGELNERILLANHLQVRPLLDLTCAAVASLIKGKSPEQIREMFNIKNDFTPEEEEKIREENKWCEDL